MRRILIALTVLLAIGMTATAAMAQVFTATTNFNCAPQGTHFARNAVAPVCTVTTDPDTNTVTVSCTGTDLQGVGNTNAETELDLLASADILCRNPGNANVVTPHTTPIEEDASNTDTPSRNGRIAISPISALISEADVEQEFTCPNPNWTEEVTDITLTSFTYMVTFDGFVDCPVFSIP